MTWEPGLCECGHMDTIHMGNCRESEPRFVQYYEDNMLRQHEIRVLCACQQFTQVEAPQQRLI